MALSKRVADAICILLLPFFLLMGCGQGNNPVAASIEEKEPADGQQPSRLYFTNTWQRAADWWQWTNKSGFVVWVIAHNQGATPWRGRPELKWYKPDENGDLNFDPRYLLGASTGILCDSTYFADGISYNTLMPKHEVKEILPQKFAEALMFGEIDWKTYSHQGLFFLWRFVPEVSSKTAADVEWQQGVVER